MKLVWFRNDLRLADNPALRHACAEAGEVAALFVISPTQWQQHKMAPIRQRFLLAQVDALGLELAALGIELHLLRVETFAETPAALASLCRELGVTRLYANQAIELGQLALPGPFDVFRGAVEAQQLHIGECPRLLQLHTPQFLGSGGRGNHPDHPPLLVQHLVTPADMLRRHALAAEYRGAAFVGIAVQLDRTRHNRQQ